MTNTVIVPTPWTKLSPGSRNSLNERAIPFPIVGVVAFKKLLLSSPASARRIHQRQGRRKTMLKWICTTQKCVSSIPNVPSLFLPCQTSLTKWWVPFISWVLMLNSECTSPAAKPPCQYGKSPKLQLRHLHLHERSDLLVETLQRCRKNRNLWYRKSRKKLCSLPAKVLYLVIMKMLLSCWSRQMKQCKLWPSIRLWTKLQPPWRSSTSMSYTRVLWWRQGWRNKNLRWRHRCSTYRRLSWKWKWWNLIIERS